MEQHFAPSLSSVGGAVYGEMRTTPTVTIYSQIGTPNIVSDMASADAGGVASANGLSTNRFRHVVTSGITADTSYRYHFVADAEL